MEVKGDFSQMDAKRSISMISLVDYIQVAPKKDMKKEVEGRERQELELGGKNPGTFFFHGITGNACRQRVFFFR